MKRMIPLNVDSRGGAKTVLSGYYKYGTQTLLLGDFGTTGTVIAYVHEDDGDEKPGEELR